MTEERDRWPRRLHNLQLGGPLPALRTRTLAAVRRRLAAKTAPSPGWGAEMLLTAAVLAGLVILPRLGGPTGVDRPSIGFETVTAEERLIHELGLGDDLAAALRFRWTQMQTSGPEGRLRIHDYREP